jgi:site-specific recombinase XerC
LNAIQVCRPPRDSTWQRFGCYFPGLTKKGILAINPARGVQTERFSRIDGKTPAFADGEIQQLLNAIDVSDAVGLRDRARPSKTGHESSPVTPP